MGRISDNISNLIHESMKLRDRLKLSTLKMLSSALSYEKIAKLHDLSDEEELSVVKSEAKKRKDAILAYEKAGARDRAEKEKSELAILREFLPAEMTDDQLSVIVDGAIGETQAASMADLGKVMSAAMKKVAGQVSGDRVSEIVKRKLE